MMFSFLVKSNSYEGFSLETLLVRRVSKAYDQNEVKGYTKFVHRTVF